VQERCPRLPSTNVPRRCVLGILLRRLDGVHGRRR
jgi:hypothetical protein